MAESAALFLVAMAARTAIVLVVLIVGVRVLTGRHAIGDLNTRDILTLLMMANAVQNAMTKGDGRLTVALAASGTLLLLDWGLGVTLVARPSLERRLFGTPVVVVQDARMLQPALRREGLTEEDVRAAMRKRGIGDLRQVRLALLEQDGSISVIPKSRRAEG